MYHKRRTSKPKTRWTSTRRPTSRRRVAGTPRMKNWTPSEVATLRKFYRGNSNQYIAKKLSRSEGSVQYKASALGLRKSRTYLREIRNNWS